jgi:hypothetical protein
MEKEFRFFSFGLASRLILATAAFALGAALELVLPGLSLLGLVVAAAGWLPLMLLPATNRPKDQGLEEWRLVSMVELDRLKDSLRESKKLKRRMAKVGNAFVFLLPLPAFIILLVLGGLAGRRDLAFIGLNAVVFLVPAYFFGRVSVFEPKEIAFKMPSFDAVLEVDRPEGIALAPYFRFDKDEKGRDLPEDLRLLFELKRAPADLVGIQVQAAVNKGPNGNVPYLYAVLLTKGREGPSYAAARRLRSSGWEIEVGGDDDYGTVVIRQETSGGGYYTSPEDCARLAGFCYDILGRLAAKAS